MTKLLKEIEFQTNKVFTKRNIDKPLIEELGYHIAYKYRQRMKTSSREALL